MFLFFDVLARWIPLSAKMHWFYTGNVTKHTEYHTYFTHSNGREISWFEEIFAPQARFTALLPRLAHSVFPGMSLLQEISMAVSSALSDRLEFRLCTLPPLTRSLGIMPWIISVSQSNMTTLTQRCISKQRRGKLPGCWVLKVAGESTKVFSNNKNLWIKTVYPVLSLLRPGTWDLCNTLLKHV